MGYLQGSARKEQGREGAKHNTIHNRKQNALIHQHQHKRNEDICNHHHTRNRETVCGCHLRTFAKNQHHGNTTNKCCCIHGRDVNLTRVVLAGLHHGEAREHIVVHGLVVDGKQARDQCLGSNDRGQCGNHDSRPFQGNRDTRPIQRRVCSIVSQDHRRLPDVCHQQGRVCHRAKCYPHGRRVKVANVSIHCIRSGDGQEHTSKEFESCPNTRIFNHIIDVVRGQCLEHRWHRAHVVNTDAKVEQKPDQHDGAKSNTNLGRSKLLDRKQRRENANCD
ncbi:hypothetical protein ATCV1_z698L [Acanthocystis turfacea chlorella virus 1]|uniref:Uncharacterized protein z698L n=1 Tax=Chlorovirus heliozoae TaxID=322019 RepID=A7K9V8_9PHYC|nr:hypothetical protein ATCV1_z698L [Acanthocystis turfacea chlorella virus 1]ABT16832.1 hypothetical protein ATCV1_z698L [Acanthocystis turfacea chlorella virus 1]